MQPTYRDATPADAAALDALFRASFTTTFGHLYAPADLAAAVEERCGETMARLGYTA